MDEAPDHGALDQLSEIPMAEDEECPGDTEVVTQMVNTG
jgi:hypothetical protein